MPSTTDVPDGPHRQLLHALHQLYRDAGKPGIHHTSKTIRARSDLRDTISHEAISKILRGEVMPRRWQKLEALIRQYLDWSVDRPSPGSSAATVRRIQALWHQATDANDDTVAPETPPAPAPGPAEPLTAESQDVGTHASLLPSMIQYRQLLYPDGVVSEAMKLPDDQARDFLINQTRRPGRGLAPLAVALMPTLPEEGIRLLNLAGITHDPADDSYIADVVAQIQRYPSEAWCGHDPLRALLRNVGKRADCGVHLIQTLMKQDNAEAAQGYLKVYAERTSPQGAAELVEALTKARAPRSLVDQALRTVSQHTPRPLAQQVPEQLRQAGRRREARLLDALLADS
ncbi:hypothetical protein OS965_38835 [Streptomyces sp. H27-G5]|uniref:hypothetical protein n=1 Tax=Streptomyces sp. H27-G5 TaxID=2996698 RepID=UPI002270C491|nr:hypothetical protein [Streptomyces sp. H27-G5]MCY0924014.1 hypothetical protein [Streptomyces sp. H27-G5]